MAANRPTANEDDRTRRALVERVGRLIDAEKAAELAGDAAIRWRTELLSIADRTLPDTGLDEFLQETLEAVRRLLEADSVSILVADDAGSELIARASVGLAEDMSPGLHISAGAGVAGRVIQSRHPMLLDDLSAVELASPLLADSGVRSLVAVPILVADEVTGVLHAGSFETSYFKASDVAALTIVAERLAGAMERVKRAESERNALLQAERTALLIGHLQRVTAALSGELTEDEVARALCRETTAATGGGVGSCTMWMRQDDDLVLVQEEEAADSARAFGRMPISGDYPGAFVARTGEALWIASNDELVGRFPVLDGADTLGAKFAVLPFQSAAGTFGVLAFSFSQPGPFAPHERAFLLAIAEQASQAFERARLRALETRMARHDSVLASLSGTLSLSLDYGETLDNVVACLVPSLADVATIHLFGEGSELVREAVGHRDPNRLAEIRQSGESEDRAIQDLLGRVAATREFLAVDGARLARGGDQAHLSEAAAGILQPLEISSALLVRLSDRGRILGVLSLARLAGSPAIDPEDHVLFLEIGRRVAVAISNAKLHAALNEARRVESFLLAVATALAGATGYRETLQRLASVAVPTLGDLCFLDLLEDDGSFQRVVAHHGDPSAAALVSQLRRHYVPKPDSSQPVAAILRHNASWFSPEISDEMLRSFSQDEDHYQVIKQLGWKSLMAVPLPVESSLQGTLTLVSAGSGRTFGPSDVNLAERLAAQVASVVEQARRYDREHRISHVLQASLLPSEMPQVAGVDLAVRYLPGTRHAEVGGDFYDALLLPSGTLAVTIGDVAGHDHQAAAVMGHLRSAIRTLSGHVEGPGEVAESLQRNWRLLGLDRLATAVFCHIDPGTGSMEIVSAGHPPPLIVSSRGAEQITVRTGPPLGAPPQPIAIWKGRLDMGSVLVLYTDGLIDDRTRDIDENLRLLASMAADGSLEVEPLCDRLVDSLGRHRSDDVALLALARRAAIALPSQSQSASAGGGVR